VKLRYTQTALRQIDEALDYVRMRSPQGAARINARMLAAVDLIRNHPNAGQKTNRPGTRRMVLIPYPYAIFYRVADTEIVVLRFRHTARKPLPPKV
jgi:plasmid stabilization system protein ParE